MSGFQGSDKSETKPEDKKTDMLGQSEPDLDKSDAQDTKSRTDSTSDSLRDRIRASGRTPRC